MSNVTPLFAGPGATARTTFDRAELNIIMNLYGRMVAAGHWRDYAVDMERDEASFAAFRRAAERPEIRIIKRPQLRLQQGQYLLIGEAGAVLRRGHDLGRCSLRSNASCCGWSTHRAAGGRPSGSCRRRAGSA